VRRVDKPWGWELIFAETASYVGKVLHVARGKRLSRQYHRVKEETLYVVEGCILLETGPAGSETSTRVGKGEAFHVPPGTIHRFTAIEETDLVEVSTPHLADVVRLEDDFGREGTSAP